MLYISEILVATTRFFVLPELIEPNERDGDVLDCDLLTGCIRLVKNDTIKLRKQIDSLWWAPQLNHGVGLKKVVCIQLQGPKSKRLQCVQDTVNVYGIGLDPYIEILCVPGMSMQSDRISPHHQVPDATIVQ